MTTLTNGQSVTNVNELVQVPPMNGNGVPTGDDDGWRFCVETSGADAGSGLWDVGLWDVAEWAALEWNDITANLRGVTWNRGASNSEGGYPRPDVGTATLEFDNTDFQYSSWNQRSVNYFGFATGALIRFATFKNDAITEHTFTGITNTVRTWTDWYPLFTGIVEEWTDIVTTEGERRAIVVLAETTSMLSRIDRTEVSPVGSGEMLLTRMARLLNDAVWKYGLSYEAASLTAPMTYTLQATNLSANRLSEVYLTADSTLCSAYSDVDGTLLLRGIFADSTDPTLFLSSETGEGKTEYTEEISFSNNADRVINDVSLTQVGSINHIDSTSGSYPSPLSTGALLSQENFGIKSYNRTDLISNTLAALTDLATALLDFTGVNVDYAGIDNTFAFRTIHPGPFAIFDEQDIQRTVTLFDVVEAEYYPVEDYRIFLKGKITSITHNIIPLPGRIAWSTEYLMTMNTILFDTDPTGDRWGSSQWGIATWNE